MSLILEDVSQLLLTMEEEYYPPGQPTSFWDRHKGKILLGGGLLGLGLMANQGTLGAGAKNFIQTNSKMIGGGLQNLGTTMGGAAQQAIPAAIQQPHGPQLGMIARKINDVKKGFNGIFAGL